MSDVDLNRRATIHGIECVAMNYVGISRILPANQTLCAYCPHSSVHHNTCGSRNKETDDCSGIVWTPIETIMSLRLQGKLK